MPSNCRSQQRGDALLESMVAIALLGVVGLGLSLALGRTLVAQKHSKTSSVIVQGVRAEMLSTGLTVGCPNAGAANTTRTVSLSQLSGLSVSGVTKTCGNTAITITPTDGTAKTVYIPSVNYSVSQAGLMDGSMQVSVD